LKRAIILVIDGFGIGSAPDASRFDEIALVPWAEAVALLPQPDPLPE